MAPEVGHALHEARTRRGIELSEVERVTKIRSKYLRAMEEDRWELLPGAAYARGFLSTYAHFLELDDEGLVEEYKLRHERVETPPPIPVEMLPKRGVAGTSRARRKTAVLVGLVAAAVLGLVVVLGLPGGSENGGDGGGREARPEHGGASPSTTPATERTVPQPAGISLRLRSIGTVWVCLLGDRGRALVNGETLTADEVRGPFEARAFKVTFGNGSVQMEVDGKPVGVPRVAEPLGYRITSRGVSELDASSRPTCL
jgi:hypothetical protein